MAEGRKPYYDKSRCNDYPSGRLSTRKMYDSEEEKVSLKNSDRKVSKNVNQQLYDPE